MTGSIECLSRNQNALFFYRQRESLLICSEERDEHGTEAPAMQFFCCPFPSCTTENDSTEWQTVKQNAAIS